MTRARPKSSRSAPLALPTAPPPQVWSAPPRAPRTGPARSPARRLRTCGAGAETETSRGFTPRAHSAPPGSWAPRPDARFAWPHAAGTSAGAGAAP